MLSQEDLEASMAFHLLHSQLRLAHEQAIEDSGSMDEQRLQRDLRRLSRAKAKIITQLERDAGRTARGMWVMFYNQPWDRQRDPGADDLARGMELPRAPASRWL